MYFSQSKTADIPRKELSAGKRFKRNIPLFFQYLTLFLTVLPALPAGAAESGLTLWKAPRKKLIDCSWASPDTAYLRAHLKEIEAAAPYDGIRIRVEAMGKDRNGKVVRCNESTAFTDKRWEYEWFKPALDDMKHIKFTKFTDNFLQMTTSPGDISWFDDGAWANVCNNFAILSRFAKESGMKGIFLDPESYAGNPLFRYNPASGKTQAQTVQQARKRGKEFGVAIFKEFPEIKIGFANIFESNLHAVDNPELSLCRPFKYSLYIPFINGIFDALPPTATLIERFGSAGYKINKPVMCMELRYVFQNKFLNFLDPAHRNKYLTQVQMAPEIYMDAYFINGNPGIRYWYNIISAKKENRLDLMQRNLAALLEFSDEYACTYSELGNWWPWEYTGKQKRRGVLRAKSGGGLWEKVAPGVTAAVEKTRDIVTAAEDFLHRRKPENLLARKNGDFEKPVVKADKIPGWTIWKKDGVVEVLSGKGRGNSHGLVIRDTAKGLAVGNQIEVKPAERYIVIGYAKTSNENQDLRLRLDWSSAENTQVGRHLQKELPFGKTGADSFQRLIAIVDVPIGAKYLRPVLLTGALKDSEEVVFDDFSIYLWE